MMQTEDKLQRQFGLLTATALLVGQVIAIGIFLTPAGMAKSLGSPFWLLFVWTLMGLMALSGALCYGELASRFPEAGGSYVYLRECYGPGVAFLYGWMVLLVLDPGITAALAVGMTSYAGYLIPLSAVGKAVFAISTVLILALANILGAKIGANVLKTLTVLKLCTLFFIIVFGFASGFGDWSNFTPFVTQRAGSESFVSALAGGMIGAFFAFAGWWELSRIAGEIKEPTKNLPRALTLGVGTLMLVYILTSAVFIYLVPLEKVTDGETFAAQAGEVLFGRIGGGIFSTIIVISVLGTLAAYLMASPRVYYAMARDGLFFKSIAELHPRFKTPHRATLIQATLATILILTGTFDQIVSYIFFITVFFITLTAAGIFIIRRRHNGLYKGYLAPLYPVTPLFFLLLSVVVLLLIAMRNVKQTLIGIAVVLLGIPVYNLFFRKER